MAGGQAFVNLRVQVLIGFLQSSGVFVLSGYCFLHYAN